MALYLLSYELRNKRDYQAFHAELEKFSAVKVLESVWCFDRINTTAMELSDYLADFIDKDDGLLVVEVTDWAVIGALPDSSLLFKP